MPGSSGDWKNPRSIFLFALVCLLLAPALTHAQKPEAKAAAGLDQRAASQLLDQAVAGLNGRDARQMLGVFDLNAMNGGTAFKDQVTAFINQTDSVRVRFRLLEVTDNVAVADMEMDAILNNDMATPVHKHMQLRFTAGSGRNGWKFTDVQPRNFFSQSS